MESRADPLFAGIGHCAGIAIVTNSLDVHEETLSCLRVARILSTFILVVTDNRSGHTDTNVAYVVYGALISVFALGTTETGKAAPLCTKADIFGALQAVVAWDLVGGSVAVVVDTVAEICGGDGGIASRVALCRAYLLSLACTELVSGETPPGKSLTHRIVGALALTFQQHTLLRGAAIHRNHVSALVARRTLFVQFTRSATEGARCTKRHTG